MVIEMAKEITLTTLRDLAAELGLELVYRIGKSESKFTPVTHDNFRVQKHIIVTKNGELFLERMNPEHLMPKLERAAKRKRKAKHISDTKATYGRE